LPGSWELATAVTVTLPIGEDGTLLEAGGGEPAPGMAVLEVDAGP
jgi:hypothetical protein